MQATEEEDYDVVGTVKLRDIVGVPVTANVAKLRASLADDVDNSLTVICAACEEANEDLILPSNVVERLFKMLHEKVKVDSIDNGDSITIVFLIVLTCAMSFMMKLMSPMVASITIMMGSRLHLSQMITQLE